MNNALDKGLSSFVSYLQNERHYSPRTIESYQTDLLEAKSFWQTNGGFTTWESITERDVELFLQNLAEQQVTQTTQARKLSSLKSFYRFLTRRKLIKVNPTQGLTIHTKQKKLPQFFYAPELKQVFATLSGSDPLTMRNLAMFELFYTTGMRVSEVSELKLAQIDLELNLVLVHGKGNKDRYTAFDEATKQALTNYLHDARSKLLHQFQDCDYVFLNNRGKQLTTRGIEYIMQKVFNKAGVSGKVHPHELRHSFATAMLNNGADLRSVQELLGHSNLSTTQIYTHVTTQNLQTNYERFFTRNNKKDEAK
ncbi:site-specific tyrosine recombinase/integron integrase [Lactobacillus sp. ESL0681]|uniref:site-specific tyrosine recombinase/integron integrase n=1 Tax=Lactobacillus sp. ESL0681 TaxID=2983211 RepID=UPI0023F7CA4D|nr:site-specific tyrosine recombinase/integron integrase [Lactobacillus sp. ESL0681]WEV40658.1 tyrosine recombinase XerC [Lactobacillus sp. ESL0681]